MRLPIVPPDLTHPAPPVVGAMTVGLDAGRLF